MDVAATSTWGTNSFSTCSTVQRVVGTEILRPATAIPCSSVMAAASEISPITVSLLISA